MHAAYPERTPMANLAFKLIVLCSSFNTFPYDFTLLTC